jgi:hypothetical protein
MKPTLTLLTALLLAAAARSGVPGIQADTSQTLV